MDNENTASQKLQIPCPACDDLIVIADDVGRYVRRRYPENAEEILASCATQDNAPAFAFRELGDDRFEYIFARETPAPSEKDGGETILRLDKLLPSFDSIAVWRAVADDGDAEYTVCIHFPVSAQKPLPENCRPFMEPCDAVCRVNAVTVQVYRGDNRQTLRRWREDPEHQSHGAVLAMLERVAALLGELEAKGHCVMRISPDTIAVSANAIRLMGLVSADLPWNERCVETYRLIELASIAPECRGYIRQSPAPKQTVYALASIAYFLIAGTLPQTCEALDFEPAAMPRAYNPDFAVGFDEAVLDGLRAMPDERAPSIEAFMHRLAEEEKLIGRRALTKEKSKKIAHAGDARMFRYDAAVDTHVGIAKVLRCPVNQDAVWMAESAAAQRLILVVGDGVSTSTYGSGDIASRILVETAESLWREQIENADDIDPKACVARILETANARVCEYIQTHFGDLSPLPSECMGSTAIVAIIEKGMLTLGSSGDSRAYIVRSDAMHCITRDHNLFTVGLINHVPVEICAEHPHAGSLVRCLGFNVDESGAPCPLEYDLFEIPLIEDDRILITTDGILDYVACDLRESEKIIAQIVRQVDGAADICKELIMKANLGGGGDNCGVAVVCARNPEAAEERFGPLQAEADDDDIE